MIRKELVGLLAFAALLFTTVPASAQRGWGRGKGIEWKAKTETVEKAKEADPDFELHRTKIQQIAGLLFAEEGLGFTVEINHRLSNARSNSVTLQRGRCLISVSAPALVEYIETEAGLAGSLGHEVGHCYYKNKGEHFTPIAFSFCGGHPVRVPRYEIEAEEFGAQTLADSPYTFTDRAAMVQFWLDSYKEKINLQENPGTAKTMQETINEEYIPRLDLLREFAGAPEPERGRRVSYFVFSKEDFLKLRDLARMRVGKQRQE